MSRFVTKQIWWKFMFEALFFKITSNVIVFWRVQLAIGLQWRHDSSSLICLLCLLVACNQILNWGLWPRREFVLCFSNKLFVGMGDNLAYAALETGWLAVIQWEILNAFGLIYFQPCELTPNLYTRRRPSTLSRIPLL